MLCLRSYLGSLILHCDQCDQIGGFLKLLGAKFYDKRSPNIGDFLGYFENISF